MTRGYYGDTVCVRRACPHAKGDFFVMLDPSRDGSAALTDVITLTITGTFEYHACDDNVCFAPQSIPLSWSIGVKPLDRERAKPQ